jgi:hypothetical protein
MAIDPSLLKITTDNFRKFVHDVNSRFDRLDTADQSAFEVLSKYYNRSFDRTECEELVAVIKGNLNRYATDRELQAALKEFAALCTVWFTKTEVEFSAFKAAMEDSQREYQRLEQEQERQRQEQRQRQRQREQQRQEQEQERQRHLVYKIDQDIIILYSLCILASLIAAAVLGLITGAIIAGIDSKNVAGAGVRGGLLMGAISVLPVSVFFMYVALKHKEIDWADSDMAALRNAHFFASPVCGLVGSIMGAIVTGNTAFLISHGAICGAIVGICFYFVVEACSLFLFVKGFHKIYLEFDANIDHFALFLLGGGGIAIIVGSILGAIIGALLTKGDLGDMWGAIIGGSIAPIVYLVAYIVLSKRNFRYGT